MIPQGTVEYSEWRLSSGAFLDACHNIFLYAFNHKGQDVVLAPEVSVESAFGDSYLLGDSSDRDVLAPVFDRHSSRGISYLRSPYFGALASLRPS